MAHPPETSQPALWDDTAPKRRPPRQERTPLPARRPTRPVEFEELWDIDTVAAYLGVPKQTIYSWRHKGYGPQGFRVGKHLRWRAATVVTWTLDLERRQ